MIHLGKRDEGRVRLDGKERSEEALKEAPSTQPDTPFRRRLSILSRSACLQALSRVVVQRLGRGSPVTVTKQAAAEVHMQ